MNHAMRLVPRETGSEARCWSPSVLICLSASYDMIGHRVRVTSAMGVDYGARMFVGICGPVRKKTVRCVVGFTFIVCIVFVYLQLL